MAENEKPKEQEQPKEQGPSPLMREAMMAYGIRREHVMSATDYGDRVVILTMGGKKVSYSKSDDEVVRLTQVELDGIPPEQARKEREAARKKR